MFMPKCIAYNKASLSVIASFKLNGHDFQEMSPLVIHTNNASVPIEPLDDMDETTSESTEVDPSTGKVRFQQSTI